MKPMNIERRSFMKSAAAALSTTLLPHNSAESQQSAQKPNIIYIFADQWRAGATGYAGDPNAKTPHLDALAAESVNFSHAVSGCPVCSPYRASLLTGRYPLSTGVFVNDVHLGDDATSIAQAFNGAGYDTGYIGKWHINARGRGSFIPRENRQGFAYWKALECTHAYNDSYYYGDKNIRQKWEGYDSTAQTADAESYIREHSNGAPFALFLSWGPPHDPYPTAPEKYRKRVDKSKIILPPNVPAEHEEKARNDLAGYYAHIMALDDCIGSLVKTIKDSGIEKNTILVFTSDHGDMLGSQGYYRKQKPWDESIRVPFLLRYPALHGNKGKTINMPINTPDIMPTILGLSGVDIPDTVEGSDFSDIIRGKEPERDYAAIITSPWPFAKYRLTECRGIRTSRYIYVITHDGPWLLYDNDRDPYQLDNLCDRAEHRELQKKLDATLSRRLRDTNDEFLPGIEYIKKWGYEVDESGAVPY